MTDIITNHHTRDLLYWEQLTDTERQEFDWMDASQQQDYQFFRYKGWTYCTADFMSLHNTFYTSQACRDAFPGWDGYLNDTFFSGILVRYPVDEWGCNEEGIIVGTFYAGSDND